MPMLKTAVLTLVAVGAAIAQSSYDDERFHNWGEFTNFSPDGRLWSVHSKEWAARSSPLMYRAMPPESSSA